MPVVPILASVHYRVELAGGSLESAVATLRSRRIFKGVVEIRQATAHLQAAAQDLAAAGTYPDLTKYVTALVAFYQAEAQKLLRPAAAQAVAVTIAGNQGNLLAADPVLSPGSAH